MADEAEAAPEAALAADLAPAHEETAEVVEAPRASPGTPDDGKAERFTAIIRNGLSNSALSRDAVAWASLETLLPEVVAALIKEA